MDVEFTEKASDFLTYLQQLENGCADVRGSDPSKVADIHRNLYLHLIRSSKLVCDNNNSRYSNVQSVWKAETDKYLDKYAQIVDNMDDTGLNNFAEGSLALCNYHKNESTKWKTSLSLDKILQICLQNSNDTVDVAEMEEDCTISLQQTAKTATSVTSVLDQGSYSGSIQESQSTAFSETHPRRGYPKQQIPGIAPDNSREPKVNNQDRRTLSSVTSSVRETSFQNTNNGWHQPVPSNDSFSTHINDPLSKFTTDPFVGMQRVSGNLRNVMGNKAVHVFQDHSQGHHRNEHQITSDDLLINASKVGGPYANFGQKPKSSLWASMKDRRSGAKQRQNEDDNDDGEDSHSKPLPFRTAKEQLVINQQKKYGDSSMYDRSQIVGASYGAGKKSLGTRRGPASKFVPPVLSKDSDENESSRGLNSRQRQDDACNVDEPVDERLRGIEPKMIELINNEIMDHGKPVLWSDIAGLEFAKKTIKEIVVWPMLRPDIFVGLRGPPKGLLLFGPPGTGKTLIGKCVASQSKSTFFCISASTLTSKWVGEGEKMVRALFAVARCHQPAVVFIDEIDSLLSQRSDAEHESSRRIKTEFLVQIDGASTNSDDRILVIGATNRPQEIDEAARRRFVKRLLIPLPDTVARQQIITNLMSHQNCSLTEEDIQVICNKTEGYSGADMTNLCREAALGPIRSIPFEMMETISPDQVQPILFKDFEEALLQVRASVSSKDLQVYTDWNQTYGSFGH